MENLSFFEEDFSYEPRMISSKCFSVSSFVSFVLIAIMTASTVVSININNNNNNNNNNVCVLVSVRLWNFKDGGS